jgi:hypothetical protein
MRSTVTMKAAMLLLFTPKVFGATLYVSMNSPNPTLPYASWDTGSHVIQDAIDVAASGDEIVVTNGTYSTGGRAVGTNLLVSRVAINKALTVRSVNGPQFTTIVGRQLSLVTNGTGAVRCAYLTDGASLSGFTLIRGATRTNGVGPIDFSPDFSGGGVCCDSTNALITNCVINGNAAYENGGGVCNGTLNNCTLMNNWTLGFGGGAYGSTLNSCLLSRNWADSGGGVKYGVLNNCVLSGNIAGGFDGYGGGARNATLRNCTVVGNSAAWEGGGATGYPDSFACVLDNCIVCFNSASYRANDADYCALIYCWTNDPLFVNYSAGNLRLNSNSPCVNAGNNSYVTSLTDFDGKPRIFGGTVDIGAFEWRPALQSAFYDWLQSYGLPGDGSADFLDSDGDGRNNWEEWVCGTSPTNKLSVLKIVSASVSGGGLAVSWQSVAGVNYIVESTTNLSIPFTLLATDIPGQEGTTSFTDTRQFAKPPIFYRVGVVGP